MPSSYAVLGISILVNVGLYVRMRGTEGYKSKHMQKGNERQNPLKWEPARDKEWWNSWCTFPRAMASLNIMAVI
jgi:hypothetical protein